MNPGKYSEYPYKIKAYKRFRDFLKALGLFQLLFIYEP